MAREVVCPNCRDELDIPEELLARPVKCASCGTVFTPADATPVVSGRDPSFDDDRPRRPRHRPTDFDARPRRRLLTVLTVLLAGTFGVCCLGCVGLLVIGFRLDNPDMQEYRDPAGRFTARFPGPPQPTAATLPNGSELTGVGHTREILGQEFDACSVKYYDLPRAPEGDAGRDDALAEAAEAIVAAQGGMAQTSLNKVTAGGYPAVEVAAESPDADFALFCRIILVGKRLYFLSYEGRGLAAQSQRLNAFWNGFQVTEPPAAKGR